LDGILSADDTMGFSLAVLVPGYQPWIGVAGESELGVPVTTGMAFGAGSVSKNFIAALVLQLAEEGKLSLDDQLDRWLPEYPNLDGSATIRQLLNHTSGTFSLEDHPDFYWSVSANRDRVWTDEELLSTFLAEPLSAKGTEWHYSNTGYLLLGQIVEEAAGASVSAELRDRFFDPLGLATAFYLSEETAPGEVAEGWFDIGRAAPQMDIDPDLERFSDFPWTATMPEAGGLFASAEDLATWARALFHDRSVLGSEALGQMLDWTPLEIPQDRAQILADYGLGAVRYQPELFDGALVVGASGGALFYSAAALYLPDHGVAIGVTQNSDSDAIGLLLAQVVSVITSHVEPAP